MGTDMWFSLYRGGNAAFEVFAEDISKARETIDSSFPARAKRHCGKQKQDLFKGAKS